MPAKKKKPNRKPPKKHFSSGAGRRKPDAKTKPTKLRIIGGEMGGRPIVYHGEEFTRPMKDNIRENLFNILGRAMKGAIAFDLFAGTAALAFESISRGANQAIAIEQSRRAIDFIQKTVDSLPIDGRLKILQGDAFRLGTDLLGPPDDDTAWIVFLCPPYILWEEQTEQLNGLIQKFMRHAPPGSVLVAETEKTFDHDKLPPGEWDLREYGGTRLAFIEPVMQCGLTADCDF
ncbi:RsmD family RNA methyltransferase [Planctomycetes bacterium K23_9]|uniref:Ribosomal RNA small subunit methyltransferase D n=1 Tax=Stieleria marina TaxID=1930275 RepID=A0A517P085_9BACT|nr:Ribosomal RNA small subunit methyltransferase D [Planctomycetes bacterium K23_9]